MHRNCIVIYLMALLLCAGVALQAQQTPPAEQKPPAEPTSEKGGAQPAPGPTTAIVTQYTDQTGEALAAPPAVTQPQTERLTGYFDFGYRWLVRQNGSLQMYRTLVNLGEGPKFFGAHISWLSPRPNLWDRFEFDSTGWGDEPYSMAKLYVQRAGYYDALLQYREQHYFSNVPSFANPLLPAFNSLISQNAYDIKRRMVDADVTLFPNRRFSPFFTFNRTSRRGPGFWSWPGPGNEYLVSTKFDDFTNLFRAGTHINLPRLYLTVEGGGTFFQDGQTTFFGPGFNPGNRRTPLFGQLMSLSTLLQQYDITANMGFFRFSVKATPLRWLDLTGQFGFAQPSGTVRFTETATGQLVAATTPEKFTSQVTGAPGRALMPRPSGNAAMIVHPWRRLRIVDSYDTVRFHNDTSTLATVTMTGVTGLLGFVPPSSTIVTTTPDSNFVASDYNRNQIEAIFDVFKWLSVRGGWRSEWGQWVQPADEPGEFEFHKEQRNVALGGVEVSLPKGAKINFATEVGRPVDTLYRFSLHEYHKVKLGGRWNVLPWLRLNAKYTRLYNNNDAPDIQLAWHTQEYSFGVLLAPNNGKRVTVSADYMYQTYNSNMLVVIPFPVATVPDNWAQNGAYAGSFVNLNLFRGSSLNFGGSLLVTHGTRATKYYQPRAEVLVPVHSRVAWFANWQYWDYNEKGFVETVPVPLGSPFFTPFENFSANLFSTGLRINLNKPQ